MTTDPKITEAFIALIENVHYTEMYEVPINVVKLEALLDLAKALNCKVEEVEAMIAKREDTLARNHAANVEWDNWRDSLLKDK